MRICCVLGPFLPVPPVRGGAVEKIWLALCEEFARSGHAVTLISRRFDSFPLDETVSGVRHLRVPSTDAPKSKVAYRLLDVVYAAQVAMRMPDADITITNSVSLPLLLPRSRAGRIVVCVNRYPKGQMGLYRRADRLQAVSTAVADAICAQSPALAGRVKVIPNALSRAVAQQRTFDRGTRTTEVLYAGRIAREKGLELLIRAFGRANEGQDWTLTLLGPSAIAAGGDGDAFVKELHRLAGPTGGQVRFEAPIYDEGALAARLAKAEIFVYPSIAERGEAFGMAPLEAMSCGCAVIVSALSCFRDFVDPERNALVFDHTASDGVPLAEALRRLMQHANLRGSLAQEAIETAKSFDSDKIAGLFLDDFNTLTGDKSPKSK